MPTTHHPGTFVSLCVLTQASDNDLINQQPLSEDIQDGYQQDPEEHTQDAEAMQQLPEAQGIHEEHGPTLYDEVRLCACVKSAGYRVLQLYCHNKTS